MNTVRHLGGIHLQYILIDIVLRFALVLFIFIS